MREREPACGSAREVELTGGRGELVQIRQACLDDIPRLGALLGELFSQEADFSPDAGRQQRGLRLILDHPDSAASTARPNPAMSSDGHILFTISTSEEAGPPGWRTWLCIRIGAGGNRPAALEPRRDGSENGGLPADYAADRCYERAGDAVLFTRRVRAFRDGAFPAERPGARE